MSDLVERLAKKRGLNPFEASNKAAQEARWWLNAIADELEENSDRYTSSKVHGGAQGMRFSARWLRNSTSEVKE